MLRYRTAHRTRSLTVHVQNQVLAHDGQADEADISAMASPPKKVSTEQNSESFIVAQGLTQPES